LTPAKTRLSMLRDSVLVFLSALILFPLAGVYYIGFRWWLEPLLTHQAERKLRREIRRDFSFLFDNFQAQFVPNERKYRWGKF